MQRNKDRHAIPFLKWAGGKRWLIERIADLLSPPCGRYIEPFLGSGAVYFHLRPRRAILSDANESLIRTYKAIKSDWRKVFEHLRRHDRLHDPEYYYKIRASRPTSDAGHAARFIYLNRTCWNGLYRVNFRGEFNVPIGTKSKVILDFDDFESVANLLRRAKLNACDFEECINTAGAGDLVFADPPYTVKHNYNGFVKYNETLFTWEDQIRLRDAVAAAHSRGATVLVTNANHKTIRQLYKGIGRMTVIKRASVIGGTVSARGPVEELLIQCS